MQIRYTGYHLEDKYGSPKTPDPSEIKDPETYQEYLDKREDPFKNPSFLKSQQELSALG